jgi:1,4-dihydroxy-2-naphthoyl-CoA hydrolase
MAEGSSELGADTLEGTLGFEGYVREGDELARATMPVTNRVRQPFGIVHGGAYAALAESLCSRATFDAVAPGNVAMGQVNECTFLRPISEGTVHAVGRARHRGRTSWVWDVEMCDDEARLCALSRVVIAVRPMDRTKPG